MFKLGVICTFRKGGLIMSNRAKYSAVLVFACVLSASLVLTATAAWAQTTGKPPDQLGKVSFANSCQPAVQAGFERAVALLHSFWWWEGEKAFREVLERDPNCAIATWGIATILIGNPYANGPTPARAQQAKEAIERGRTIGAKTEFERLFIEAVAQYYERFAERAHGARMKSLSDAFEDVARRFPEDDEAQIFSAIYLTATQNPSEQTFASALKAAAILEPLFKKHPDHPGVAHYLIHSYDYPPIAEKGLNAAKRYSEIAPSVPHALHMPSHIFTRVGAWQESAASNLRSATVAKAEKEFTDQLHAMDYLVYTYLQLARDTDAQHVVEEAPGVQGNDQVAATPYALAAIPARYAFERGAWKEAAQLQPPPSRFRFATAFTHFARALGAARSGDAAAAEREVQELARIVEEMKAAKNAYWTVEVDVQRLGASAWVAQAKGDRAEALKLMRASAELEAKSEKAPVSPGRLVPANELLGDMLLEHGKPAEALATYERSQVRDPNRFRSLYGAGEAAAQSGNRDKARYYFSKLIELAGSGDPRPEMEKARRYLAGN
jgi:tetratricopeptide (TPR) repeat protein